MTRSGSICIKSGHKSLYLGGVLLQLVVSSGSEGISAHETRLPALLLVVPGQLRTRGRFTRTLEDEHVVLK